jgi:hypothetical protein
LALFAKTDKFLDFCVPKSYIFSNLPAKLVVILSSREWFWQHLSVQQNELGCVPPPANHPSHITSLSQFEGEIYFVVIPDC